MSQRQKPAGADASDVESGAVAASGARESSSGPPVDVGAVIDGRYELLERLGAGGMGYVFGARDRRLQRPVAVKVIRSELAENKSMARRFEREALASSRLSSPHVVVVHDFGATDAGVPYLVMERLYGRTLARVLKEGGLPFEETLRVASDIVRALVVAHGKGIVHRDLKPDNVFLTDDGTTKVLDFGIAKILDQGGFAEPSLTGTGMMLGTPLYMSPESVRRRSDVGPPADMYSTGSILFRMLTGRPVFVHEEPVVVLSMHVQRTPPKLTEVRRDLAFSGELEALVDALLRKDPSERPTAEQALAQLEAIAASPRAAVASEGEALHDVTTAVIELPSKPPAPPRMAAEVFEPTTVTPPPAMPPAHVERSEATAVTPPPAMPLAAPVASQPAPAVASAPAWEPAASAPPADRARPAAPFLWLAGGVVALAVVIGVVVAAISIGGADEELRATELPRGEPLAGQAPVAENAIDLGEAPVGAIDVAEPEVGAPEVAEPELAEPEVAAPEVAEPEVAEPEVAEPELAAPAPAEARERAPAAPGRLRIDTDVEATVSLDGRVLGAAPGEIELPAGRHRLLIESASGRRTLSVTIEPGGSLHRRVSLAPRAPARGTPRSSGDLPELPSAW